MFAIGNIDLTHPRNILERVNIRSTETGVILDRAASLGRFTLPLVNITLAIRWEGFDLIGSDTENATIAIRSFTDELIPQYFAYDPVLGWVESNTEAFYPEADFRIWFKQWSGAFQLSLGLNPPTANGSTPRIQAVRYGYHTIGDYTDYTVKYQLSQFLSVPASFVRTVRINGDSFPIPKGFDPTLIINPGAYEVTGRNIDKPLAIANGATGINEIASFTLISPQINAVHQIHFDYPVPIDTQNEYIPQIESVPAVFFRNLSTDNLRFLNTRVSISIDEQTTRIVQIPYLSDLKLDVLVFGDTAADANAISEAMTRKIAATGGFWNPGFNCDCLVQLMSAIVLSPSGGSVSANPVSGMLFSNTLRLKLIGIPHGAFYTEQQRISKSELLYSSVAPPILPVNWQGLSMMPALTQDETLTFRPDRARSVWTIDHNFGAHPMVVIYSTSGEVVTASIVHISLNRVVCDFTVPFLGYAELTPTHSRAQSVLR